MLTQRQELQQAVEVEELEDSKAKSTALDMKSEFGFNTKLELESKSPVPVQHKKTGGNLVGNEEQVSPQGAHSNQAAKDVGGEGSYSKEL